MLAVIRAPASRRPFPVPVIPPLVQEPVERQQAEGQPTHCQQLQVGDGRQPVGGKGEHCGSHNGGAVTVRPTQDEQVHSQAGQHKAEEQTQIMGDQRFAGDDLQRHHQAGGRQHVL